MVADGGKLLILGIDPALAVTGYGIILSRDQGMRLVASGEVKTKDTNSLAYRLHKVYSEIRQAIEVYRPTLAVLEEGFYAKNVRSAISLGQARGAAMVACAEMGLEVKLFSVREIRQAVAGRGGASKEQVAYMVRLLLGLDEDQLTSHDITDSLAAAICAAQKMETEQIDVRLHKR